MTKALTLTEPWATLMKLGEKNIETRSWRTSFRGPVAIHAAKAMPMYAKVFSTSPEVVRAFLRHDEHRWFQPGKILCIRSLLDCVPTEQLTNISAIERQFGDYTPGRYAWVFAPEIELITPPIEIRGALGLWEWSR